MLAQQYRDFFSRPVSRCRLSDYKDSVLPPRPPADVQAFTQLYADCFDHHIRPGMDLKDVPLTAINDDARRVITKDSLTARFINHHYTPPTISETSNAAPEDIGANQITFTQFVTLITNTAQSERRSGKGSNRFSYLVGAIGIGKSLLAAKLQQVAGTLPPDRHDARILPVYVDLELHLRTPDGRFRDVDATFTGSIVDTIWSAALTYASVPGSAHSVPLHEGTPVERLRLTARVLAQHDLRLLIILDNTDRFHFSYSKHSFFDEEFKKQIRSVQLNFGRLVDLFTNDLEAGDIGASVLLTCRESVFEDYHFGLDAANNQRLSHEDHRVFRMQPVTPERVLDSRFALFQECVQLVTKTRRAQSEEYQAQLSALKVFYDSGFRDHSQENISLRTISELGHHRLRSLVDFVGGLSVDYRRDWGIVERLFKEQPYTLIRLFMTNLRKRFSQSARHFPNLFLNDAVIRPEEGFEAYYKPHPHTYWLKYLLLKAVVTSEGSTTTFDELSDLFTRRGDYKPWLFKLALGSLCSVNDSYCLEVTNVGATKIVTPTPRGRFLVGPSRRQNPLSAEFCFGFEYLQLIVDDYLLAVPKPWFSEIFADTHLGYSLKEPGEYGRGSWDYLQKKTRAVLYFLRVLKASFAYETSLHSGLLDAGAPGSLWTPKFDECAHQMLSTYDAVLSPYPGGAELSSRLKALWAELDKNSSFDDFWVDYRSTLPLTSPS